MSGDGVSRALLALGWWVLPLPVLAQELISDLRLDGSLWDRRMQTTAVFSRPSEAYTCGAVCVPPEVPRFETFAAAAHFTEWILPSGTPHDFRPIALLDGKLFAADALGRIFRSADGEHYEHIATLPQGRCVNSAAGWPTPGGELLVATGHAYAIPPNGELWRSDGQGTQWTRVLTFLAGTATHWNFTTLGSTLFVSEYGTVAPGAPGGNARHIFRSDDDGRTWQLIYDPPPQQGVHCHQLLADPWSGYVYQAWGDTDFKITRTCDGGQSWELVHNYFLPTAGLARAEGIYWGHEGGGTPGIHLYHRGTGHFTHVFRPWFYENGNDNIYNLLEYNGVIYCPFAMHRQELWASPDGEHWTYLHGPFGAGDAYGLCRLVGFCGQWLHCYYVRGPEYATQSDTLRFRPGQVAAVRGLRLEPPAENLLANLQNSSAEEGLTGWVGEGDVTLTWDPSIAFHGNASIRVDLHSGLPAVRCPPVPTSIPVGLPLKAQLHLIGDEHLLGMRLFDEHNVSPYVARHACAHDAWTPTESSFTVQGADNRIRARVACHDYARPELRFWIDGYQITIGQVGRTWVPGGTPRAADVLRHAVAFGDSWTDLLCFSPDFNSIEPDVVQRAAKAWVADPQHYVKLVFDIQDRLWKLVEVVAGGSQVLCACGPVNVQPGAVHRFAVSRRPDGCELRLRIGTAEHYVASGPPWAVQPAELWIGSSPAGGDGAPGVYALSRTFDGALSPAAIAAEFDYLPPLVTPGDCNCDGAVDFGDINPFVLALTNPAGYAQAFPNCRIENADINQDGRVDFGDINPFVRLLTGP